MRERSKRRAELLSLSSSSSASSKRVLMWLYCCVISTLSKSVVEVMAAASVGSGTGDGGKVSSEGRVVVVFLLMIGEMNGEDTADWSGNSGQLK